jgi:hypothetical protein
VHTILYHYSFTSAHGKPVNKEPVQKPGKLVVEKGGAKSREKPQASKPGCAGPIAVVTKAVQNIVPAASSTRSGQGGEMQGVGNSLHSKCKFNCWPLCVFESVIVCVICIRVILTVTPHVSTGPEVNEEVDSTSWQQQQEVILANRTMIDHATATCKL